MGKSTKNDLHFQSTPLGFYTLAADSKLCSDVKQVFRTDSSWNALKEKETMKVAGREISSTDQCYQNAHWYLPDMKNGTYTNFDQASPLFTASNTKGDFQLTNKMAHTPILIRLPPFLLQATLKVIFN